MRDYLEQLPSNSLAGVEAAAFDTRARGVKLMTGAASGGISRQLQKQGAHILVRPESFLVTAKEGPLMDGEVAHAHTWAQHILATMWERTSR
jgi:hypothetical protein